MPESTTWMCVSDRAAIQTPEYQIRVKDEKRPPRWATFGVGGGGENRTRVRKPYASGSTCLFRL